MSVDIQLAWIPVTQNRILTEGLECIFHSGPHPLPQKFTWRDEAAKDTTHFNRTYNFRFVEVIKWYLSYIAIQKPTHDKYRHTHKYILSSGKAFSRWSSSICRHHPSSRSVSACSSFRNQRPSLWHTDRCTTCHSNNQMFTTCRDTPAEVVCLQTLQWQSQLCG